jgi:hypothetical protein
LGQFRINKDDPRLLYPFSQTAVNTLMSAISQKNSLTPRRIMKYANHVMSEHMLNQQDISEINENDVLAYMSTLDEIDIDNETST